MFQSRRLPECQGSAHGGGAEGRGTPEASAYQNPGALEAAAVSAIGPQLEVSTVSAGRTDRTVSGLTPKSAANERRLLTPD